VVRGVRVLIVTGIWPPDVGGPASHAPELAEFLRGREHEVAVVTTADAEPAPQPYRVDWISRHLPIGVRHLAVAEKVRARARRADVVYATSMIGRSALGCRAARRPLVIKLTTDEAYERAQRRGLFDGDMDAFQHVEGGVRVRALRRSRNSALRHASRIICPSAYLREMAVSWGVPAERALVVPNPAPELPDLPSRDEARAARDIDGPALAFAGRIGRQKALEVGLEAVSRMAGVSLLVAGDGPERADMERRAAELGLAGRVRFLGPLPREHVLTLFRAADASLLSSTWENFPHTVVESLAVGTPVIATAVGGVPEVVTDGMNGLLVAAGDAAALAAAIHRFYGERGLRERLAAAAAASVAGYGREEILARIEAVLLEVVA
jgi:glycosyltransferase involved in cell wall biosynthesis